jgi:Putative prokaryotic signal transducing protein
MVPSDRMRQAARYRGHDAKEQIVDRLTVPLTVVTSRTEAELIVGLLGSNGLRAAVSDDAGGQDPQLQLEGVRVLVAPSDEAAARRILDEQAPG